MLDLFYIINCLENLSQTISLESWQLSGNKKKISCSNVRALGQQNKQVKFIIKRHIIITFLIRIELSI